MHRNIITAAATTVAGAVLFLAPFGAARGIEVAPTQDQLLCGILAPCERPADDDRAEDRDDEDASANGAAEADESRADHDYSNTDTYVFMAHGSDGSPRRFNPCDPVHYVVNWDGAPAGTDADDVHEAFARIARASGMTFVFDGATDEQPADWKRDPHQPARYGDRWAPVLVTWSTPDSALLDGPEVGRAAPTWWGDVTITGMVVLDATDDLESGFDTTGWGAVLLHEIGHVVGLTHPEDETQIMAARLSGDDAPVELHDGDLDGLYLLGTASGCLTTPSPA